MDLRSPLSKTYCWLGARAPGFRPELGDGPLRAVPNTVLPILRRADPLDCSKHRICFAVSLESITMLMQELLQVVGKANSASDLEQALSASLIRFEIDQFELSRFHHRQYVDTPLSQVPRGYAAWKQRQYGRYR